MSKPLLHIKDLFVEVEGKKIIKGLNLTINEGEVHAIMGPNGAGKSTLSYVLAGKPDYEVISGEIIFKDKNLLELEPCDRASEGIFLSMQYPISIPGVTYSSFLKHAVNAQRKYKELKELDAAEFLKLLKTKAKALEIDTEMLKRDVNVGFSGGEKKRMETLQMSLLEPSLAILDETDSGLDIDALKIVAQSVNVLRNNHNSLLIITHHKDLLEYIKPDYVHIYIDGNIVHTGDVKLANELERSGYGIFSKV